MLAASAAVMGRAVPAVYATRGVDLPNSCFVLDGDDGCDALVNGFPRFEEFGAAYGDRVPLTRSGERGKSGVPGEFGNLKESIVVIASGLAALVG
jgi:hypothetical protein